jgi:hypothetical protein
MIIWETSFPAIRSRSLEASVLLSLQWFRRQTNFNAVSSAVDFRILRVQTSPTRAHLIGAYAEITGNFLHAGPGVAFQSKPSKSRSAFSSACNGSATLVNFYWREGKPPPFLSSSAPRQLLRISSVDLRTIFAPL